MFVSDLKKSIRVFFFTAAGGMLIASCSDGRSAPGTPATLSAATESDSTGKSGQADKANTSPASGNNTGLAIASPTKYLEKDGRRIAYRIIGKGEPLILCNRFRGILDDWDPLFLDELAKQYSVVTFDYSGIGLSTLPNINDSLRELDDIHELAAALGFKQFSLIGWSHGGKVAQVYAGSHPDEIRQLILLGSGPIGKNRFQPEKIFFERALKPVNDFDDEIVLFFEPKYADSREAAKLYHARVKERKSDTSHYVTPEKFAKYFATVQVYNSNEKAKENLLQSKIPMLIISGEHDIVFPIESWYEQTGKNPNLQIIMLPRAGHGPQSQYPLLSARYIHDFIAATGR
ncbi:MAG: alpha/beta hydrolase [Chitinophagaceae bacterium]|nr:MAG: alpha/beta hydrolase [Chitinophagaceae bacterium]